MYENQRHDTAPSMRTILGNELKVLNLRPRDKSKHLAGEFKMKASTQAERIHMDKITVMANHVPNDEIGLPCLRPADRKYQKMR